MGTNPLIIKIKKRKIVNKISWRFIPSNILSAFDNKAKQKIRKIKEYSKCIYDCKNEILIWFNLISGKIFKVNAIDNIIQNNFLLGLKFFKSSKKPIKKKNVVRVMIK